MMKGKRNISVKHTIFMHIFLLVSLLSIVGLSFSKTEVQAETEEKSTTEKKERFVVDSKGRIGNYARYNEKMELVTTITNNEDDFTGYVQVIMINENYGKNVMYQADLVLAAGETKIVSQEIRWTNNSSRIMVYITDKKENILEKKKVKVSLLEPWDCLIGILSDSKQQMGYWDSRKVSYLSKEDISSSSAMGVMDVLVIDNFNTGDLEKGQYEAIKEWVELGGNLILGTGEQVNRTLAMFQDDYLTGRIGNAEKGIADISFQGEMITDDLTDNMVFHKVEKGLGIISVANTNLGINKSEWNKKGYEYINAIEGQYSAVLQERVKDTGYGYFSYISDSSALRGTDEILSVKNFAVVLGVYILIITIGTYLVLKKKDKLEWTWAVVPVIGVIFSGVIITLGSKTRISGNYMNYTNVMEFQEGMNTNAKNTSYINVSSSNNNDYEIAVPEGMDVYARFSDYYESDYANEEYKDYDIGFKDENNQQIIMLKNNQSFEATGLVAESVETVEGSYQSDIYYTNAAISGTITNQTGITIKNAVFLAEGKLYKLGTIKSGEKVEITDKTPSIVYNYYYGQGRDFYKIAGLDTDRKKWTLEEARYKDALEHVLGSYGDNITQNGVVYGYIDTDDDSMKNKWGMPCYGITLTKFLIDVNYRTKNGDIYVPNVAKEGEIVSGSYYSGNNTMYFDDNPDEKLLVEYTLEKNEHLTGIYFSKLLNPSIDKNAVGYDEYEGEIYEGKIEVYNWKTKQYETIFQADKEGEVTDVEDYVGKGNVVRFQMNPDNKEDGDICVPVISLTKEVE